jgi:hypothetical protein
MQGHAAFGVHLAPAIKAERLLWLASQRGALLLVFIKRQTATAQRFQRQLFAFFCRVRAQLRGRMGRTSSEDGGDKQQANNKESVHGSGSAKWASSQ